VHIIKVTHAQQFVQPDTMQHEGKQKKPVELEAQWLQQYDYGFSSMITAS